ncbi:hypothetical protein P20495_1987 [Pseudoalteromonas sp. BSi20495]|nr:hypothetical protein P20495_1987 [Pseudoalteromonas sp. BSi20495]
MPAVGRHLWRQYKVTTLQQTALRAKARPTCRSSFMATN